MTRDHRAEYGYDPTWDLQREKQEEVAENFYGESDEEALENAENFLGGEGENDDGN